MTTPSDLYDGDKATRDPSVAGLRRRVLAPKLFHGVRHADDAVVVSPSCCHPCRSWFEDSRRLHCPVCRKPLNQPRPWFEPNKLPPEWEARRSDLFEAV